MKKMKMVVDCSNLLFRVASMVEKRGDTPGSQFGSEEEKGAFALHLGLNSLLKYYRKYKPTEIALAFEGKNNWRKEYTRKNSADIAKMYKANRLPSDKSQSFFELIDSFKELVRLHTSMILLAVEGLEGDDVIAGYVQEHSEDQETTIVVISGDKDFLQLAKYKNVMLIDPASGKDRITAEKDFDPEYFMFEKCVRGDAGDNVMSAYPRVRSTRLVKAFKDDYERTQLMQEQWTAEEEDADGNKIIFHNTVGTLFEHNKVLMDLEAQPAHVRQMITDGLAKARADVGRYNHFHFMRFLGKHQLEAIAKQAHIYTEMFSVSGKKNAEHTPIVKETIKADDAVKASDFLKRPSNLLEF